MLHGQGKPPADADINNNIDDNFNGKIKIADTDPDSKFDNDNPLESINNLQLGEQDKQMITDFFCYYRIFYH